MQKMVKHYQESIPVHIFGLKRAIEEAFNNIHKVSLLLLEFLHSTKRKSSSPVKAASIHAGRVVTTWTSRAILEKPEIFTHSQEQKWLAEGLSGRTCKLIISSLTSALLRYSTASSLARPSTISLGNSFTSSALCSGSCAGGGTGAGDTSLAGDGVLHHQTIRQVS